MLALILLAFTLLVLRTLRARLVSAGYPALPAITALLGLAALRALAAIVLIAALLAILLLHLAGLALLTLLVLIAATFVLAFAILIALVCHVLFLSQVRTGKGRPGRRFGSA
ncbi:hypothetical protein [Erythrobacter sp.]|uniref:hypothetical protein n=1 Tax=Erythrobacter sp. TaxID=1042 RepID=UPI0025F629C7|nr:hypothetical protein [Erythrobacter sp.]